MNAKQKAKLREVYKVMLKEEWIVRNAGWSLHGPIPPEGDITDKYIRDIRTGRGDARKVYEGGLEQNMAIPSNCPQMVEDDFRVLRAESEAEGYDPSRHFELAGDMLLLAQAGVLRKLKESGSTNLRYWGLDPRFSDLAHSPERGYKAMLRALIRKPGERHPEKEKDLAEFDEMVMEAYRR